MASRACQAALDAAARSTGEPTLHGSVRLHGPDRSRHETDPPCRDSSSFCATYWSDKMRGGYTTARHRSASTYDADVLDFFRELSKVEMEYARALERLCERVRYEHAADGKPSGAGWRGMLAPSDDDRPLVRSLQYASVQHTWSELLAALRSHAKAHQQCCDDVRASVIDPLKGAVKQERARREEVLDPVDERVDGVRRARARAESTAQQYASSLRRYRKQSAAKGAGAVGPGSHEAALLLDAASACADAVATANEDTALFEDEVQAHALNALQEHEEKRLESVDVSFSAFASIVCATGVWPVDAAQQLRDAADKTDVPSDICAFADAHSTRGHGRVEKLRAPICCDQLAAVSNVTEAQVDLGFWGSLWKPVKKVLAGFAQEPTEPPSPEEPATKEVAPSDLPEAGVELFAVSTTRHAHMAAATASFPTPDSACSDGASWRYGSDGSSSSLLHDSAADDTSGECEHAERTELGDGSDLLGTLPAPIKEGAGMKADRGYVDGSMESDAILDSVNEMVAELGGEGLTMLEAQLLVAEVLDGEESESSVDGIAPEESAGGALGDEWYFVDDMDAVQGPIDWSALKDAVSNGNVQSQTWVFRSGMPDWIAADDVPDLVDLPLSSSPIPPPPPTASPPKKEAIARNLVQDENYSANALPSHGAAGLKISTGSEDSCAGTDKFDLISPLVSKRRRTRGKSSIQHRTHRFSARFELEDLTEGEQESRKSPTSNQNPPAPVDEPADRTMPRNIADASMHKGVEVEANTEHSVDESRMTASQLLDAIAGFDKERRLKKVKRQSRIFGAKRRSVSRASLGSVPPLPLPGEKESTIASLLAHAIMRRRSEMNYDEEDF